MVPVCIHFPSASGAFHFCLVENLSSEENPVSPAAPYTFGAINKTRHEDTTEQINRNAYVSAP